MTRSIGARLALGALASTLVAVGMLAVTRALNFDEALALHSGWLYASGADNGLPFMMPVVYLVGAVAVVVTDPGLVLVGLRALVVVTVAAAFWFVVRRLGSTPTFAALWILLTVANGAFLTHAVEFRYDWAILVAWLLAFAVIAVPSRTRFILLGALIGWLCLHHLKGAFYGGALYLMAWIAMRDVPAPRVRPAVQMHVGIATVVALWIVVAAVAGRLTDVAAVYIQFTDVALTAVQDDTFVRIVRRVVSDIGWWIVVVILASVTWLTPRGSAAVRWSAVFAAVPVAFMAVHPLPWPYLLAPVVPFASFAGAAALARLTASRPVAETSLVAVLIVFAVGSALREAIPQYRGTTLDDTVVALRYLRIHSTPSDTVVDPSGTAYFLPPADPEWYTDTLFRERADRGSWQASLASAAARADWALTTYRLNWLPDTASRVLEDRLRPVCGPLRLHRDDPRFEAVAAGCPLGQTFIESVW